MGLERTDVRPVAHLLYDNHLRRPTGGVGRPCYRLGGADGRYMTTTAAAGTIAGVIGDWLGPVATALVGIVGIAGTLTGAAVQRRHDFKQRTFEAALRQTELWGMERLKTFGHFLRVIEDMRRIAIRVDESADRHLDAQLYRDKWAELSVEAGPILAELYLVARLETASAAANMANMLKRWFEEGARDPNAVVAQRNLIMMMRAECNPLIRNEEVTLLRQVSEGFFASATGRGEEMSTGEPK